MYQIDNQATALHTKQATTMNQTQTTRTPVPSLIRMNAFNPDKETYAEYKACADERHRLLNDAATPRDLHQTLKTKAGMSLDEIHRLIAGRL